MPYKPLKTVRWSLGISGFLSSVGIALWIFINKYANSLPSPASKAGRQLLRQYQGTTADIFLGLTIASISYLAFKILSGRKIQLQRKKCLLKKNRVSRRLHKEPTSDCSNNDRIFNSNGSRNDAFIQRSN